MSRWSKAVQRAPEFTDSYLGQQGDPWDAHMDMAFAALGAALSMLAAVLLGNRLPLLARAVGRRQPVDETGFRRVRQARE